MRTTPEEFRHLDLRVHTFLADVPLHDVWRMTLRGGGPDRTVLDFKGLMAGSTERQPNPAVRGLFALRGWLGRAFGWDDPQDPRQPPSYQDHLTEADRGRTLEPPGSGEFFQVLYTFERETLAEIRNRTVHAFVCFAIAPDAGDDWRGYMAVYVKPVGVITRAYMSMIDPFRRLIIYPSLIRQLERRWAAQYGA